MEFKKEHLTLENLRAFFDVFQRCNLHFSKTDKATSNITKYLYGCANNEKELLKSLNDLLDRLLIEPVGPAFSKLDFLKEEKKESGGGISMAWLPHELKEGFIETPEVKALKQVIETQKELIHYLRPLSLRHEGPEFPKEITLNEPTT